MDDFGKYFNDYGQNFSEQNDSFNIEGLPYIEEDFTFPSMHKVYLIKNERAPDEFISSILKNFFHIDESNLAKKLNKIEMEGKVLCGIYTKDVSETKIEEISEFSYRSGYPLKFVM